MLQWGAGAELPATEHAAATHLAIPMSAVLTQGAGRGGRRPPCGELRRRSRCGFDFGPFRSTASDGSWLGECSACRSRPLLRLAVQRGLQRGQPADELRLGLLQLV